MFRFNHEDGNFEIYGRLGCAKFEIDIPFRICSFILTYTCVIVHFEKQNRKPSMNVEVGSKLGPQP